MPEVRDPFWSKTGALLIRLLRMFPDLHQGLDPLSLAAVVAVFSSDGFRMPNDLGGPTASIHLFQSVARDFEALSAVIGRTIEAMNEAHPEDVQSLRRAKQAADNGASLAKKGANFL